jgi:acetoin utilization deacetylase AcuC-like enzyme
LYPLSGRIDEIGAGAGQGTTVNVPLPPGVGDDGYARALDEIVVPLARRYRPQLLMMSAGFDAHWVDELAGMSVSLRGFAHIVAALSRLSEEVCEGRLVVVLEGGYDHDVLSYGVLNTLRVLRGESPDAALDPLGPFTGRPVSADPIIRQVKAAHGLP